MQIANPIFDTYFKLIMSNMRLAKFLISTLLNKSIDDLQLRPQEYIYDTLEDSACDMESIKQVKDILRRSSFKFFRLDFIATIRASDGTVSKVLIEVQRAENPIDVMRFRNYLGEHYKLRDLIDGEYQALPITTIYILGFNLKYVKTACTYVKRVYVDAISNERIKELDPFIEQLTHDCHVVQTLRIEGNYRTTLEKLLSVFEQNHFVDNHQAIKEFKNNLDNEEIKMMIEVLHNASKSKAERGQVKVERETWRAIAERFEELEVARIKAIAKTEKIEAEKAKAEAEKAKAEAEKAKAEAEKAQMAQQLESMQLIIDALRKERTQDNN